MTEKHDKKKPTETVITVSGSEDEHDGDAAQKEKKDVTAPGKEDEKYLDQLLRLQAEFQNYRKRTEREWSESSTRVKGDLIKTLLPVLDDFQRMLIHHGEEPCSVEGVQLIYQKLIKILNDEGLEQIETVGKEFDPDFHEAIGIHGVDEDQDGMIADEWEPGYRFSGRLLRPSKVRVGRHTKEAGDSSS
jgi:molecular chaperone GrpE